jgi:dipeptidyl aminopeptidase/acylaminoacyl peptidase
MRARRRWIAVGLGVVVALGVAGYAGASYFAYDQLTAATPDCGGRFPDDYTPASFGTEGISPDFTAGGFDTAPYAMPGYQEVSFPSRDARHPRLTIRAWWVPADKAGAPAVIVVHGWNSCRHDPVVLLPAGMLARNGFSVLMMDMRDQGDSDRDDGRSGWGSEEYLDVLGAWDWLQSAQGLEASRIGLMGESLGGSSATIAMGEEQAIAATWADSAFADLEVLFDERIAGYNELIAGNGFPTWLRAGAIAWAKIIANDYLTARSPVDEVEKIGARPLAIVHGLADDDVELHHAMDLAAAHAKSVPGYEPWLVPRALHLQAAFAAPAEYERRIVEFFRASLGE